MEEQEKSRFPKHLDHLNKTFLEELNYKMWVTKGARFNAGKRLLQKSEWSNRAMGFLSAYLIIIGLLSVYQISKEPIINPNIVAFGSTAISILLLAFGQMEAAQDYKMRGKSYHDCALKISKLYNELRTFKTMNTPTVEEKNRFASILSDKYQALLDNYANHDSVDFALFKAKHKDYFNLKNRNVVLANVRFYLNTLFLYHFLIIAPIIIAFIVFMIK